MRVELATMIMMVMRTMMVILTVFVKWKIRIITVVKVVMILMKYMSVFLALSAFTNCVCGVLCGSVCFGRKFPFYVQGHRSSQPC